MKSGDRNKLHNKTTEWPDILEFNLVTRSNFALPKSINGLWLVNVFFSSLKPFTPRPSYSEMICHSNLLICWQNPSMLPFKWNLLGRTFAQDYLFLRILRNEIWNFGWIFCFGHVRSERVKQTSVGEEWITWQALRTTALEANEDVAFCMYTHSDLWLIKHKKILWKEISYKYGLLVFHVNLNMCKKNKEQQIKLWGYWS